MKNPNPDANTQKAIQNNIERLKKIEKEIPQIHKMMCAAQVLLYLFLNSCFNTKPVKLNYYKDQKVFEDVQKQFNTEVEPILGYVYFEYLCNKKI